ncbi:MAG: Asp23/Gls24 family envelope stress response protein [Lachnospiraceae bacterium]|nr:Asp23/Gls24 family envelope stress response protein [Lachnospiraceae bacterium]
MANETQDKKTLINSGVAGDVKIADDVVAVIAALAAQEVEGVATMAGGMGKTIMAYVGMKKADKGVRIEVSDGMVRADVSLTILYGHSIPDICKRVQEKIKTAIEYMTGLSVADVNIKVVGIQMGAAEPA